jgi:hypothetical protein
MTQLHAYCSEKTVKDSTTGEKRSFSISHLTNCFSEDFFKELVARINTLPFQNGVGGKQQSMFDLSAMIQTVQW